MRIATEATISKARAKHVEFAMVIDISHPIQSLFTSEDGISRH
jgi:hypothetical protein